MRRSEASASTSVSVRPPATPFETLKWRSPKLATCGRWVTTIVCPVCERRFSFASDGGRFGASDAGVHLVEDDRRSRRQAAPHGKLEREVEARELATRRGFSERREGLAGIGCEEELHPIEPGLAELDPVFVTPKGTVGAPRPAQPNGELGALEGELFELGSERLGERLAPARPRFREFVGPLGEAVQSRIDESLELTALIRIDL